MDHESGALQSDRPGAVRTAEETRQQLCGQSTHPGSSERATRGLRRQRARPPPATRLASADAGRATGYRNRIFLRADVLRSGDQIETTPRNREDPNPFGIGETPPGARRNVQGSMSSGSDAHDRDYRELVFLYALQALPSSEFPITEAHISACADCQREMETL